MLQAMEKLDAIAAVDKEWEKLEKLPGWQKTKVKSKKKVCFDTLMDICHTKHADLERKCQK